MRSASKCSAVRAAPAARLSLGGVRFEIPARLRHLSVVHVRYVLHHRMSLPENPSQTAADSTSSMEFQVTSLPVALLVACLALSAGSSQQMYSSGQAYKHSECN